MPKISVIVPVYNTEQYLHRCIDSILAQTYTDFELLLIDDGSKDNSGKICNEYAAKDSRFRVFHKENGGVSSARNTGLQESNGEWITFIDADDWITSVYLKGLIDYSDKAPMVATGFQYFGNNEDKRYVKIELFVDFENELTNLWNTSSAKLCWYPWGKLFRNDIITNNKILFNNELIYSEDFCFVLDYMNNVDSLILSPINGYMYFRDTKSSNVCFKYPLKYKSYKTHVEMHEHKIGLLEDKYKTIYRGIRNSIFKRLTICFMTYLVRQNFTNFKSEISELGKGTLKSLFMKILLGKVEWISNVIGKSDILIYILIKYRYKDLIK